MTFKVFDALLSTGKPSLASIGFESSYTHFDQGPLYLPGAPGAGLPPEATVRALAAASTEDYIILDIETGISIANYITVVGWVRDERPDAQIGCYGYGPALSGNVGIQFGIGHASYTSWVATNDSYAPLIAVVDFLAPSYYMRNARLHEFINNIAPSIVEAYRIRQGKPIYPFVWPRYHDLLHAFGFDHLIPADTFGAILRFLRTGHVREEWKGPFWDASWVPAGGVDGVFMWGEFGKNYDANAAWLNRVRRIIDAEV